MTLCVIVSSSGVSLVLKVLRGSERFVGVLTFLFYLFCIRIFKYR